VNDQGFDELLARYSARFQPLSPLESLGGGGGLSGARLWWFRAGHGDLVLRAWPSHGPGRKHVEQLHRWLFMASELGFVPVPVRDRAGRSLQEWGGTLWEVTPWLPGVPDFSCPPLGEHLRFAFSGLALFHQRLGSEQANELSAGLRRRHDEISHLIEGGFDTLETAIMRQSDADSAHRRAALGWLSLARNLAPRAVEPLTRASNLVIPVQPTVRDARPEHFLFDGERLSGLVDFGAMGVDSVAGDLARLIGEWTGGDATARREALASYERVRPLDPTEVELIAVFEAGTALLIGERWVRWHFIEHRTFDDPQAVSSGLARGLQRLERVVRDAAGG
jgi:Phosphotransferase enzyme family